MKFTIKILILIFSGILDSLLISADDSLFYCVSLDCQEPISFGKTLLIYRGKTDKHLSFNKNDDIKVLSKPVGIGDDWVAEYRGKIGLVPQSMVKEQRMSKYDIKYKFPFNELPLSPPAPDSSSSELNLDQIKRNIDDPYSDQFQNSTEDDAGRQETSDESEGISAENVVEDPTIIEEKNKQEPPPEVQSNNEETPATPVTASDSSEESQQQQEETTHSSFSEAIPNIDVSGTHTTNNNDSNNNNSDVPPPSSEQLQNSSDEVEQTPSTTEGVSADEAVIDPIGSPSFEILVEPVNEVDQHPPSPSEQQQSSNSEEETTVVENEKQNEDEEKIDPLSFQDDGGEVPPTETETVAAHENLTEHPPTNLSPESDDSLPQAPSNEYGSPIIENTENVVTESTEHSDPTTLNIEDSSAAAATTVEPISSVDQTVAPEPVVEVEGETLSTTQTPPNDDLQNTNVDEPKEESLPEEVTIPKVEPEEKSSELETPVVHSTSSDSGEEQQEQEAVPSSETIQNVDHVETPSSNIDDNNNNVPSSAEQLPNSDDQVVQETPNENEGVAAETVAVDPIGENKQELPPSPEVQSSSEETPVVPLTDSGNDQEQQQPEEAVPSSETIPNVEDPSFNNNNNNNNVESTEAVAAAGLIQSELEPANETPVSINTIDEPIVSDSVDIPIVSSESVTELPSPPEVDSGNSMVDSELPPASSNVETEDKSVPVNVDDSIPISEEATKPHVFPNHHHHPHEHVQDPSHDDHHGHHHRHHHHHHHEQEYNSSSASPLVTVVRHLSATLLSFLPEALQDSILDVNDAQIFTGIIALTLISICVPYFFIETVLTMRPLKKQVEELSNSLWKSKTAYEIQLEEFEVYKKKALAHDAKQKRIEQLENELLVVNKLLSKQKDQIKHLQKELKVTSKAAANFESIMESTRRKKDEAITERDSLLAGLQNLQEGLKMNVAELEDSQAEARLIKEQFEQATHEKETLGKLLKKAEMTIEMVKTKTANEHELRCQAEDANAQLRLEMDRVQEDMKNVKDICEQYEKTASALSEEVTSKENELLALKETLGEDSPLIEIAEARARSATAEEEAGTLRKRVESMSIEISSLSRNYEETKSELTTVKEEKVDAENRLQVLESWFKKQEDELRATVEKYETERNIRGKDESELIKVIHDKDDEIRQLKAAVEALKQEIEEIKTTDKAEIRKLEARVGDNFLQMCQSERKINEARKEAELLRQKLAAVARQGDDNGAGDLYSGLLGPDMNPLPPLPDDLPLNMPMPSYFGMDDLLDPLPPLPLGTEPLRPAPLGRMSPGPYGYPGGDDDGPTSPIAPAHGARGDYSNYSSGSNSPIDSMRPGSRDDWINDNRTDRPRSIRNHRGPIPNLSSSPIPHGVNL